MPTTYKILGQAAPAINTPTALYAVPPATQAVVSTLAVCNRGVSTTYRVAIRPAGAAIVDAHYLAYNATLNANETVMLTLGLTLSATDIISVEAGSTTVSFSAYGAELS